MMIFSIKFWRQMVLSIAFLVLFGSLAGGVTAGTGQFAYYCNKVGSCRPCISSKRIGESSCSTGYSQRYDCVVGLTTDEDSQRMPLYSLKLPIVDDVLKVGTETTEWMSCEPPHQVSMVMFEISMFFLLLISLIVIRWRSRQMSK